MDPSAYLLAIASAFCNATFFAPNRLESVKQANIHPIVYNWYTTIGVFLFSWLVATYLPYVGLGVVTFTPAGFVAGALFTLALLFSCFALPLLGLSIAQGVWAGAATLISFLWGTIGPAVIARPLADVPLSMVGISLIIAGILGIIYVDEVGKCLFGRWLRSSDEAPSPEHERLPSDVEGSGEKAEEAEHKTSAASYVQGVIYALSVGLFGGSMLVPLAFVPAEFQGVKGIGFIPSFGTGSLMMGTFVVLLFRVSSGPIHFACGQTLWAGITSGCVWQLGNVCQVIAQSYYGLPYAIAYPIFQSSLVFAGFLGIVVFKEITGRAPITFFFIAALAVVSGANVLAFYGPIAAPADGQPTQAAQRTTPLLLSVSFDVKPERRDDFIAAIRANEKGTTSFEPLNLAYKWGEDDKLANRFHFHEEYLGQAGLDAHLASQHVAAWNAFVATDPFAAEPLGPFTFYQEDELPKW